MRVGIYARTSAICGVREVQGQTKKLRRYCRTKVLNFDGNIDEYVDWDGGRKNFDRMMTIAAAEGAKGANSSCSGVWITCPPAMWARSCLFSPRSPGTPSPRARDDLRARESEDGHELLSRARVPYDEGYGEVHWELRRAEG